MSKRLWLEVIVDLLRPEYPKQPEAILTDLIWRSPGSSLGVDDGGWRELSTLKVKSGGRKYPMTRLVFVSDPPSKPYPAVTFNIAVETRTDSLFTDNANGEAFLRAFLSSLEAPRTKKVKSTACVPVDPNLVVLQTLHGLVGKWSPANVARIVETVAWHGGAEAAEAADQGDQVVVKWAAASCFLEVASRSSPGTGLPQLLAMVSRAVADHCWESYHQQGQAPARPAKWPGVKPRPVGGGVISPLHAHPTPFKWFWGHWKRLCDGNEGSWFDELPTRRWVDWALCLLRTGLAFGYLWNAKLMVHVYKATREVIEDRGKQDERDALWAFLDGEYQLGRVNDPSLLKTHRNVSSALKQVLLDGEKAKQGLSQMQQVLDEQGLEEMPPCKDKTLREYIEEEWLGRVAQIPPGRFTAGEETPSFPKNVHEFIRYALRQRSSEDDSRDQEDLYYVARSEGRNFWFEPGPEWLVVVASLCTGRPGGTCTLHELIGDLRLLGLHVARPVLVRLLEDAGLTTDSPDADEAIIIKSAF